MHMYKTRGTCATAIKIETDGDIVKKIEFTNGCRGNTQGIAALAKGMKIGEVIERCKGIQCHNGTSCPDQLARALEAIIEKRETK